MTTLTRRRSRRDDEPDEARDERPARGRRRASDDMPDEERNTPRRERGRRDEEEARDERPSRRSRSRDDDADERPSRSRSRSRDDGDGGRRSRTRSEGGRGRRSGHGGFSSYTQKKRSSSFAEDFKVEANNPTLIKLLDAEPFDVYNEHWLDEMPTGSRKSYVCLDDEYYADDPEYLDEAGDLGCPLDDIGDQPRTKALFNVLDLTNPRKPEVRVWSVPPSVADTLERMSGETKTKPLNREDLYFEVTLVKKNKKYSWTIVPVKARDLAEDYDIEPFDSDELADFEKDMFTDRSAVTKSDTYDELAELADSLDD